MNTTIRFSAVTVKDLQVFFKDRVMVFTIFALPLIVALIAGSPYLGGSEDVINLPMIAGRAGRRSQSHEVRPIQMLAPFLPGSTQQKFDKHLSLCWCLRKRDLPVFVGIKSLEERRCGRIVHFCHQVSGAEHHERPGYRRDLRYGNYPETLMGQIYNACGNNSLNTVVLSQCRNQADFKHVLFWLSASTA